MCIYGYVGIFVYVFTTFRSDKNRSDGKAVTYELHGRTCMNIRVSMSICGYIWVSVWVCSYVCIRVEYLMKKRSGGEGMTYGLHGAAGGTYIGHGSQLD